MAEENSFKFGCPYCAQHIRAYDEHIGETITCPRCQADIVVPNPYKWVASSYEVDSELASVYSPAEMLALSGEAAPLRQKVLAIPKQDAWELAALATILEDRLEPLNQALATLPATPTLDLAGAFDQKALYRELDDHLSRLLTLLYSSYDVLLYALPPAMTRGSLVLIVDLGNRLGTEAQQLAAFQVALAARRIPSVAPFPELHQSLLSWVPHVAHSLNDLTTWLRARASLPREEASTLQLQMSIVPPAIHHYLTLRQELAAQLVR